MLSPGLLLSGSNCIWENNQSLGEREDGILTAYEISHMKLSDTESIVLSACETGMGDINGQAL